MCSSPLFITCVFSPTIFVVAYKIKFGPSPTPSILSMAVNLSLSLPSLRILSTEPPTMPWPITTSLGNVFAMPFKFPLLVYDAHIRYKLQAALVHKAAINFHGSLRSWFSKFFFWSHSQLGFSGLIIFTMFVQLNFWLLVSVLWIHFNNFLYFCGIQ